MYYIEVRLDSQAAYRAYPGLELVVAMEKVGAK